MFRETLSTQEYSSHLGTWRVSSESLCKGHGPRGSCACGSGVRRQWQKQSRVFLPCEEQSVKGGLSSAMQKRPL